MWLVEEGIGEDRAIRLTGTTITHALLDWHDAIRPGLVEDAILVSRQAGSSRGVARFSNGQGALVDRLPSDASEGAPIRLEITRAAIMESRRNKMAQARPSSKQTQPANSLAEQLRQSGNSVEIVRRFPDCDWDELVGEALDQHLSFAQGALHFSPTPAMTLVDVDTNLGPEAGALAAVKPLAASLKRFGIGGSIGIDFPTVQDKSARKAVDAALAEALADWPHERTAMNGFGFVQLVARLERPSLLHVMLFHPSRAEIYRLLRQAEGLKEHGAIELRGASALLNTHLNPMDVDELSKRTGREVRIVSDDTLAQRAPHAQIVSI